PDIRRMCRVKTGEILRSDTNDGDLDTLQMDDCADHVSRPAESASPKSVADHSDVSVLRVFHRFRVNESTANWPQPENLKVILRNVLACNRLGRIAITQIELNVVARQQAVEYGVPIPVVQVVRVREWLITFSLGELRVNIYQALRLIHRQRLQVDRIDQSENGGCSADAYGKSRNGHKREAGILQQLAEGEFEVVHGGIGSGVWRLGSGVVGFPRHLSPGTGHSVRSATIGSIRAARRAGSQQAKSATAPRTNERTAKVSGSVGLTSKSRLDR